MPHQTKATGATPLEVLTRSSESAPAGLGVLGGISGKYLASSIDLQLLLREAHEEIVPGRGGYSERVCDEIRALSAATIDRYFAPVTLFVSSFSMKLDGWWHVRPGMIIAPSHP